MEFLGFKEAFTFLLGTGMIIKSFVSDRHTSIAKWMREDCPKKCEELGKPVVQHYFDIWHIGKSKLFYTMNNHNFTNETVKTNISKISSRNLILRRNLILILIFSNILYEIFPRNTESTDKTGEGEELRDYWEMEESLCASILLGCDVYQRTPGRGQIGKIPCIPVPRHQ